MKNLLVKLSVLVIGLLVGYGCGGASASNAGSAINKNSVYKVTRKLIYDKENNLTIEGKDGDTLKLLISALPMGVAKDMNLTVTLDYSDSILPDIKMDKDLNFYKPVVLKFKSKQLINTNSVLVYQGQNRDYIVPFAKGTDEYTATLLHFSNYKFKAQPSQEALKEKIKQGKNALLSYGDDIEGALNSDLIGEIVADINLLATLDATFDRDGAMRELANILEEIANKWLQKMKNKNIEYWDGYCMSGEFRDFLTKIFQIKTQLELAGATEVNYEHESIALISQRMKEAYNAWKALVQPSACNTSGFVNYVECGVKFMTDAEVMGINISGEEQMEIIEKFIVRTLDEVVGYNTCPKLNCVKFYYDKAANGYFDNAGIYGYTDRLQNTYQKIKEKVDNKACQPKKWYFKFIYNSPAFGTGTMEIKNVAINCNEPQGIEDGFAGKQCGIAAYDDPGLTFLFTGDLHKDTGMLPLVVATKDIEVNALGLHDQQVGGDVNTLDVPTTDLWGCHKSWESAYTDNFKADKAFTIQATGTTTCTFHFEPCTKELCAQ